MNYLLISPVRNEERFISKTLASVTAQTQLPERWIIVNDGSTDRTAEIVEAHAEHFPWIEVVHRPQNLPRSFAGKVHAFNAGYERVRYLDFEIVGNLDGDLSFENDYLEFLVGKFAEDSHLGVGGTPFVENGYDSAIDSFEGENHVAGGCQLFRRSCFEEIGGYTPNSAGGIDWIAVTTARMKGWKTRSFPNKRFYHHRHLGTAERGALAALFAYGQKDYYLGNSPLWQLFRFAYRMSKQPRLIGGVALACGYFSAAFRRIPRAVGPDLMRFHRAEQMTKLNRALRSLLQSKKAENFSIAADRH